MVVTLGLTFVTLVFGELAPKRVAMQRAERWALMAARPLAGIARLARPVIWVLGASTNLAVRLVGGDPSRRREDVTEEELRDLVASHTTFSPEQRTILSGAFEIGHRTLREILVPRPDVKVLDADQPSVEGVVRSSSPCAIPGHPSYGATSTMSSGSCTSASLLGAGGKVQDHARPAVVLPESLGVIDALRTLQIEREQLAVVVNEYGGDRGHRHGGGPPRRGRGRDLRRDRSGHPCRRRQPDGAFILPGRFPVHDLHDLGVRLSAGNYATVAGMLLSHLGHVPDRAGASVQVSGWRLEVLEVNGRVITRVGLRPIELSGVRQPAS